MNGDEVVRKVAKRDRALPVLGWREWVGLPDHGIEWMKAKVDTGARTSSLHAFGLRRFERDGADWVRFEVHPWQRSTAEAAVIEARVFDERVVRSSSGEAELRPVIRIPIRIASLVRPVEFTLTRRDEMGFRVLLGRQALRNSFVVDAGRSYVGGRPPRATRRRNLADDPAALPDATAGPGADATDTAGDPR